MTNSLPIMYPHPLIANPATVRAAAALPAAGAWDAAPTELACAGWGWVTFYFSYTRGAAGGDMRFRVELSPYSADIAGVEDWFQATVFSAGAVASGADTVSNIQRNDTEYGSTAAAIENFVYGPLDLKGTVERIRVACAESGVVGTPGAAHIVAVFSAAP